jgi:hypothetical protein
MFRRDPADIIAVNHDVAPGDQGRRSAPAKLPREIGSK